MNCLSSLENEHFTEEYLHVCFNTAYLVRTCLLGKRAELCPVSKGKISDRNVSSTSNARAR